MNHRITKIFLVLNFFIYLTCSNDSNNRKSELRSIQEGEYEFDSKSYAENIEIDTLFIKKEVLKQHIQSFSPELSKIKISYILKLSSLSNIQLKKIKYINCSTFDFNNFEPINPIIKDYSLDLNNYQYNPNVVIVIKPSQGIFSNINFLVSEKNGFRFIHIMDSSKNTATLRNGFIFKKLNDKYYYYIFSLEGPYKSPPVHRIMLLNDSLYPVKQITRYWFNNVFHNTEFIYKNGSILCEISKPIGDFELTKNTTFGEVFKLFNTKIDVNKINLLISSTIKKDNSIPNWSFGQCQYTDSLVIH